MEARQVDILVPAPKPGARQLGEADQPLPLPRAVDKAAVLHALQNALRPAAAVLQAPVLHVGDGQQFPLAVSLAPALRHLLAADEAVQGMAMKIFFCQ